MVNAASLAIWVGKAEGVITTPKNGPETKTKVEDALVLKDELRNMVSDSEFEELVRLMKTAADLIKELVSTVENEEKTSERLDELHEIDKETFTQLFEWLNIIEQLEGEELSSEVLEHMKMFIYLTNAVRKKFEGVLSQKNIVSPQTNSGANDGF